MARFTSFLCRIAHGMVTVFCFLFFFAAFSVDVSLEYLVASRGTASDISVALQSKTTL